jgi:hypothetical protein
MKYFPGTPSTGWENPSDPGGTSATMVGTFTCEGVEFTYNQNSPDSEYAFHVFITNDPEHIFITSLAVLGERLEALETRGA